MASDELLMDRYARGDAAAFDELYRRYEGRAYGFFLRRTGSPARAADLFQELFLRLHRSRATFRADGRFAPWFFRIARSVFVDDLRRHMGLVEALEDLPLASSSDPEREAASRESLAQALASLSEHERLVLCAAKVEGIGYGEIAQALGRKVDGVKQTASRAMRRLRARGAVTPTGRLA